MIRCVVGYLEITSEQEALKSCSLQTSNKTGAENIRDDLRPNDEPAEAHGTLYICLTLFTLSVIILATVIGNVMVVIAVVVEKNLRNVSNYLTASLAVADLMVAILVMPLAAVNQVSSGWFLGQELCDMWVSFDILCCTASILHLVAISLDRYWAVTQVDYIHKRSARRILLMIATGWGLSFIVSVPPLFIGRETRKDENMADFQCIINQDLGYTVFSTLCAFYLPFAGMIVIYQKVFRAARLSIRKKRFKRFAAAATRQSSSGADRRESETGACGHNESGIDIPSNVSHSPTDAGSGPTSVTCTVPTVERPGLSGSESESLIKRSGQNCSNGKNTFEKNFIRLAITDFDDNESEITYDSLPVARNDNLFSGLDDGGEFQFIFEQDCDTTGSLNMELDNHFKENDSTNNIPLECKLENLIEPTNSFQNVHFNKLGCKFIESENDSLEQNCTTNISVMLSDDNLSISLNNYALDCAPSQSRCNSVLNKDYNKKFLLDMDSYDTEEDCGSDIVQNHFQANTSKVTRSDSCYDIARLSCHDSFGQAPRRQSDSTDRASQRGSPANLLSPDYIQGGMNGKRSQSRSRLSSFLGVSNLSPFGGSTMNLDQGMGSRRGSWLDLTKQYIVATMGEHRRSKDVQMSPRTRECRAREKMEQRRERKAARTLAIVTGAFILCWLPFFILAVVVPFCGDQCHVPDLLMSVINWLGYFNSLLNPIIYTIFNPDFRTAFRKMILGRCQKRRSSVHMDYRRPTAIRLMSVS